MSKNKCGCQNTCYSDKVLVGNWVNDRMRYVRNLDMEDMYLTTVKKDYTPMPLPERHSDFVWDIRIKQQESADVFPLSFEKERPNYYENFSSLYDLSYNHFPKKYKGVLPRVLRFKCMDHLPTDEYLPSYGNITKYGLQDSYNYFWEKEKYERRHLPQSVYMETYDGHTVNNYKQALMVRQNVIDNGFEAKAPGCNPITWECYKKRKPIICK